MLFGLYCPGEIKYPESLFVIEDPSEESWNAVYQDLLPMNKRTTRMTESIRYVCETLLRKLDEVGCRDKNAAWNIAQYIAYCLNYFSERISFRDYYSISSNYLDCESDILNSLLADHSHGFKVQMRLEFENPKLEVSYLKFLLNYGFLQPIDVNDEFSHKDVRLAVWACNRSTPKVELPDMPYALERKLKDECSAKIRKQIGLVEHLRSSNGGLNGAFQRGYKRLMLTARCIHVLEDKYRHTNGEPYAQCIRLYFRGIPDPFVQADEVREFISFFLQDTEEDAINSMVTLFQSWFPESIAPYGPRSLQHLCRCQVREVLSQKSEVLPELVNNLKIPYRLKVYILGDS